MSKIHTCITVNYGSFMICKQNKINISGECANLLDNLADIKTGNLNELDYKQQKIRRDRAKEEILKAQVEFNDANSKVMEYEKDKQIKLNDSLEKQKEHTHNRKLCIVCLQTPAKSKLDTNDNRVVCLGCVSHLPKEQQQELGLVKPMIENAI